MNNKISVVEISQIAWKIFWKEKLSWFFLSAVGIIFMIIGISVDLYVPAYSNQAALALTLFGSLYMAILHQNGLDAIYDRKLSMMHVSSSVLLASLFFIIVSLYSPIPQYREFLLLFLPENFYFVSVCNLLIHFVLSYLLMKSMFVGMILLEKKCSIKDAYIRSFAMTQRHIFLLCMIVLYLAVVLILSALTIVGYFMVLPYTILVKSLLFQRLDENLK